MGGLWDFMWDNKVALNLLTCFKYFFNGWNYDSNQNFRALWSHEGNETFQVNDLQKNAGGDIPRSNQARWIRKRGEKGGLAGVRYRGLAQRKNFSITSNQGGLDESNRSKVGTRLLQSQQVKPQVWEWGNRPLPFASRFKPFFVIEKKKRHDTPEVFRGVLFSEDRQRTGNGKERLLSQFSFKN